MKRAKEKAVQNLYREWNKEKAIRLRVISFPADLELCSKILQSEIYISKIKERKVIRDIPCNVSDKGDLLFKQISIPQEEVESILKSKTRPIAIIALYYFKGKYCLSKLSTSPLMLRQGMSVNISRLDPLK